MKKMTFLTCILIIFFYNHSTAQDVHIDNQTPCYYIVGLDADCVHECTNNPFDSPANTTQDYSLSTGGINNATDIKTICINDGVNDCIIKITGSGCSSSASPVVVCNSIFCNSLPLNVNWWVSGSDFYIEFTL